MRILKKICLSCLLLVFAALIFFLGTTTGLHLVVKNVIRWIPGLELTSISGGWHNLTLKQLHYQIPGVKINVGEFYLSLDLGCLRHCQLCINNLSLRDVLVETQSTNLQRSVTPKKEKITSNIYTHYPLLLRRLTVNNLHFKVDNTVITLKEFSSGLTFLNNTLAMTPTYVTGVLVKLPSTTQIAVDQTTEATAPTKIASQFSLAEILQSLSLKPLLLPLSTFSIPLNLTFEEIKGKDLRLIGNRNFIINRLRMQARSHDQHAELTFLEIDSPQGMLNAFGNAQLDGHWPLNLTLQTSLNKDPMKGEKIKLTINGNLREELCTKLDLSGPINAQITLKTRLTQPGLPLKLSLNSKSVQWPLSGTAQYRAKNITLRLNGEAKNYQMTLKTVLNGKKMPKTNLVMEGKGHTSGFTLSRLSLDMLDGHTNLTAVVDWKRAINWRSILTVSDINTNRQWSTWPARLTGKIITRGSLYGANWQLQIPSLDLRGYINQKTLIARGSLSGNATGEWVVPNLLIRLGGNTLKVTGDLKNKFALDAILQAPTLNNVLPDLTGSVQGSLKLRGDLKAPQLLADFSANALRWADLSIRRIAIKSDMRSNDIIHGNLHLQINQFQEGALSIRKLTLSASGNEKQHQTKLVIQGEPMALQLQLKGSFDRLHQSWHVVLSQAHLYTSLKKWFLKRSNMVLDYQNQQQKMVILPHFRKNHNAKIGVTQNITAKTSGQTNTVLKHSDLTMLKPALATVDTKIIGDFTGIADLDWASGGGLPRGKVSLMSNGLKINQILQKKTSSITFDTLTMNARLDKRLAYLDWVIKIAENGQFSGQVQVADLQNQCNLSGNVKINDIALVLLKPLLESNENINGLINANLRFGGNIYQPKLYGQLGLEHLVINGTFIPFSMTDSRIALDFTGTSSALQGVISTTHGKINFSGNADWGHMNAWRVLVYAKGNRVRTTVLPMTRLDISPDIVFEAMPALFTLNGKVDVPWARIAMKEVPQSAVALSSDEVLFDDNLKLISDSTKSDAIPISTNLLIHVGDDVYIDAFGLKAKLKGDLKVLQDKRGLGLNGQIDIPSGHFHAYGQNLIIEKGQLLFSGPVHPPYLNIEAIRNPDNTEDDVTAGVRITGLANQPKVEVFSDPVKSQQEALSYLLRGHRLDTLSIDTNTMTSMLIGMGVAQSGKLVNKIGETFGVSNLVLDTQGVGDNSQVVVSGYITPSLQVKYGVGIFSSLATLTLRYRLTPKLYLEAVSGVDQVFNLLYRFEF